MSGGLAHTHMREQFNLRNLSYVHMCMLTGLPITQIELHMYACTSPPLMQPSSPGHSAKPQRLKTADLTAVFLFDAEKELDFIFGKVLKQVLSYYEFLQA